MDVKSLYTNIPNSEGISAVKTAYESYPENIIATKLPKIPKIHKTNNARRPVVSSTECHGTNISEFVD